MLLTIVLIIVGLALLPLALRVGAFLAIMVAYPFVWLLALPGVIIGNAVVFFRRPRNV